MTGLFNPLTTLLSHQSGLSGTPTAANAAVNVGTPITSPRAGLITMRLYGHVSADDGFIDFTLTSQGITTYFDNNTSTSITSTLFSNVSGSSANADYFANTTEAFLYPVVQDNASYGNFVFAMEIPILAGDILQFRVSNNTANETTYIDDLEVLLI